MLLRIDGDSLSLVWNRISHVEMLFWVIQSSVVLPIADNVLHND